MDSKQIWKAFFDLEHAFYEYILDNCTELYSKDPPEFSEDQGLLKAPGYIRWIGRLKHDASEFKPRLEQLRSAYRAAAGAEFKSYPRRFCNYLENVEQINLSINSAFRSKSLKPGFFTLIEVLEHRDNNERLEKQHNSLVELKEQLESNNIEAKIEREQSMFGLTHLFFKLNADDVFEYFKTDKIQVRTPSGDQYRARVRYAGASAAQRIKFGFIVVDSASTCRVVQANEQAPRPHSLVNQGRELFLPVDRRFDVLFFDKS